MNIAVIGAAGGVGQRVVAQARAAGHGVRALVRKEAQADALRAQGADVVLGDLLGEWTGVLDGTDAAVWAAGAGVAGNYSAIDGGALISLVDILSERGPRRLVAVSSMGVDRPEQMPPFLQEVLRVKAESDEYVQRSKLDWTIVRPGGTPAGSTSTSLRTIPGLCAASRSDRYPPIECPTKFAPSSPTASIHAASQPVASASTNRGPPRRSTPNPGRFTR